jgi:deazaflavin-dependent oxidoreductase (nitroreductase family)
MNDETFSMGDNPALNHTHEKLNQHQIPDWITEHLRQYQDDPANAHWWDGRDFGGYEKTPTLLLTTRGRKSGRQSIMPLIYGVDGDRYVLIGSKGGAPEHPAWYLNMLADPVVEVQIVKERFKVRARTATGTERARLFDLMTQVYPPFPAYQARTARELPVVVLERL